ncbi:hypothetical protein ASPCADRAFT_211207, partial [Aspergillus carbonarius ITEM 5010]
MFCWWKAEHLDLPNGFLIVLATVFKSSHEDEEDEEDEEDDDGVYIIGDDKDDHPNFQHHKPTRRDPSSYLGSNRAQAPAWV